MATIAGPRPNPPSHVVTLAGLTAGCSTNALKRSPRKQGKQPAREPIPSLRDSYLAASISPEQVLRTIKDSTRFGISRNSNHSSAVETYTAPSSGYKRLSSGPSSPTAFNTSVVATDAAASQEIELTGSHSVADSSPTISLKAACEKPLPPKPALRDQESPERRGVFDAQDLTANSLNGLYPPLEPTSSPRVDRSDQQSPAPSSFQITPSLLSRNHSPNSVSTGEYNVATPTSIQSVNKSQIGVDQERAGDTYFSKYTLNTPRSSKIPRHGSLLQNGQLRYVSPSRSSSSGSKANRSMLRGRQALSDRSRQSLFMADARRNGQAVTLSEESRANDQFEESATDEGTQRTSSKYGYNIRESFDAREAIMGEAESSQPKNRIGGLLKNRSTSARRGGPVQELNLELATPKTKLMATEVGQVGSSGQASSMGHPRSVTKPPGRTPPHPPRTSSLHKTPSPRHVKGSGSEVKKALGQNGGGQPVAKSQTGGISSFEAGKETPPASRLSLLYRQTAASTARASFNAKKFGQLRTSASRIPQSRTLASLSDVSKGMKNLGRKVGMIIPHRRGIAFEPLSDDGLHNNVEKNLAPRRQASRLLTTYKNSGMDDNADKNLRSSVTIGDGSIQPEPNDRHEADGNEKQKEMWREGSHNRAHDAETDQYISFGQQGGNNSDDEDDERPPSRRRDRIDPVGHYVEDAAEGEHDGSGENSEDAGLPPTRRASIESDFGTTHVQGSATADDAESPTISHGLMPDALFERMMAQTDTRARQLLAYAMGLEESRIRTLMIESANHLGQGLLNTRQARIELFRVSQALDEATVILAANTHRMAVILQEISSLARNT